jgi:hypothetical protein
MDGTQFDRILCTLSGRATRRRLVAVSLLAPLRERPVRAQLDAPACRAEGDVCTHLTGCCDALVCATSAINPNYGVCIPGEGDHVAVTTQIVTPFREGIVTELGAGLVEAEAAEVEAVALIAEQEAAEDARRTTRRTRKDTKRAKKRTRRDTRQARKRGETDEADAAPE